YAREGLIQPACKTGANMAYYDPACIGTIKLIKELQRKRYYPLSVIKRLLETSTVKTIEMDLLDAIHKVDYSTMGDEQLSLREASRAARLSPAQIAALTETDIVTPVLSGRKKTFSAADLSVMQLVRRRMDAGIPFAQSIQSFCIYQRALREAAQADVDSFITGAVMTPDFTSEKGAHMIHISDDTLNTFINIKRMEFNREYGSRRIEDMTQWEEALSKALKGLTSGLLAAGFQMDAVLCAKALAGQQTDVPAFDAVRKAYLGFSGDAGGDIAKSIAEFLRGRAYFSKLAINPEQDGALAMHALKVCWLALAPDILACQEQAEAALKDFEEIVRRYPQPQASQLSAMMRDILA
ncbi:MAG: MerR family transcriptional regulator, partial [Candidatus Pelethousia sp.]|nr:MerR family transcriptional regulator [Candidatus Pelethousia sp.]